MSGQACRDHKLTFDEIVNACALKADCDSFDPGARADAVRDAFGGGGVSCGFIAYALDCRETGYVRGVDQSKVIRASILCDDDYWTVPELDPRRLVRKDGDVHRLLDRGGVWRDEDEVFVFRDLGHASRKVVPAAEIPSKLESSPPPKGKPRRKRIKGNGPAKLKAEAGLLKLLGATRPKDKTLDDMAVDLEAAAIHVGRSTLSRAATSLWGPARKK